MQRQFFSLLSPAMCVSLCKRDAGFENNCHQFAVQLLTVSFFSSLNKNKLRQPPDGGECNAYRQQTFRKVLWMLMWYLLPSSFFPFVAFFLPFSSLPPLLSLSPLLICHLAASHGTRGVDTHCKRTRTREREREGERSEGALTDPRLRLAQRCSDASSSRCERRCRNGSASVGRDGQQERQRLCRLLPPCLDYSENRLVCDERE